MALRRNHIFLAALVLAVSVGLGFAIAYGGDDGDRETPADMFIVSQESLERAVGGLCEAQMLVSQGDLAAGRSVFLDDAHLFLHSLAAETLEVDTAAAADMLRAKYAVEELLALSTIGGDPVASPEALEGASPEQQVGRLIEEVRRSAKALDLQPPDC